MNAFLADPSLEPLWSSVAATLDRNGLGWRGRLTLPDLSPEGRRRLGIVLEPAIVPSRRTIRLADLADGIERITGEALLDVLDVLDALGHAPIGRREAAVARRAATQRRRTALDAVVEEITPPSVGWLLGWAEAAWRDGLFAVRSADEVDTAVRRVVTGIGLGGQGRSRTEIAARFLGVGCRCTSRRWRCATRRCTSLHVAARTPVLVVENPRLVESAAQRRLPAAILCTKATRRPRQQRPSTPCAPQERSCATTAISTSPAWP